MTPVVLATPPAFIDAGLSSSVAMPVPTLVQGAQYATIERARDGVGFTKECESDGFRIDATPPTVGGVISKLHARRPPAARQLFVPRPAAGRPPHSLVGRRHNARLQQPD